MLNIQMDNPTFNLTLPEKEKQQDLPEETGGQQILISSPFAELYRHPEFFSMPSEQEIINKVI